MKGKWKSKITYVVSWGLNDSLGIQKDLKAAPNVVYIYQILISFNVTEVELSHEAFVVEELFVSLNTSSTLTEE